MEQLRRVSPLRIFEKSSRKELGPGKMAVLIARAGVGKTACLINIALDKIFHDQMLVHVSVDESPEKVRSYYNVIFHDFLEVLDLDDDLELRLKLDRNRVILSYLNNSFELNRLRSSISNLNRKLSFKPDTMVIDGLDFENVDKGLLEGLRALAEELGSEVWFSALAHRHRKEVNERGIPYPCHKLDHIFDVVLQLRPEPTGLYLTLLKDHDQPVGPDARVRLDSATFMVEE